MTITQVHGDMFLRITDGAQHVLLRSRVPAFNLDS